MLNQKDPLPRQGLTKRSQQRGLVNEVVESLGQAIREGRMTTGERLPTEGSLVEHFGVSRTVIREALSRLQASGLVETRHGIGTFVSCPPEHLSFHIGADQLATVADVIALLELRVSLESEAAALAAQRRERAHLEAMERALSEFAECINQGRDSIGADFQFHAEVARATGNRHFSDLMNYLGTVLIPRARIDTVSAAPEGERSYLLKVHAEHEYIYQAIALQDPVAARAAMRTHLASSRERLRSAHIRGTHPNQ